MLHTADECLDNDGKVLYGKKQVTEKWERKCGIHFKHNSLFDMGDNIRLLPVIGMPRDFLHWIILGPNLGLVSYRESHNLFAIQDHRGSSAAAYFK